MPVFRRRMFSGAFSERRPAPVEEVDQPQELGSVFGSLLAVFRAKAPSPALANFYSLMTVQEKSIHDPYQSLARQLKVACKCSTTSQPESSFSPVPPAGATYFPSPQIKASLVSLLSDCQIVLLNQLDATSDRIHAAHTTKAAIRHIRKMPDDAVERAVERIKAYLLKPNPRFKHPRPPESFCYFGLIVQKQPSFIPRHRIKADKHHPGEQLWVLNCHTCDKSLTAAPRGSGWLPNGCAAPSDFRNWQRVMMKCHRPRGEEIEFVCPLCDMEFGDDEEARKLRFGANKLFDHLFKVHSDDEGRFDPDLEVGRAV